MKMHWKSQLVILAVLISFSSLKYFVVPYAWICFVWFAVLICILKSTRSEKVKVVCFNVGVVLLLLGASELYLYAQDRPVLQELKRRNRLRSEARNQEGELVPRTQEDDILGYAPPKNQTIQWKRYYGNDLLFDVSYTIDNHGLRVPPPYREGSDSGSILFFGGSYTFGYGVNDNETVPYLVGLETNAQFQVYNFGLCGYGPHQMLASIESGLLADTIDCEPRYAIFTAIIEHAYRCAGRTLWDWHGPKYALSENGQVVHQGHFDDGVVPESRVARMLKNQLRKSRLVTRVRLRPINRDAVELMVGIIDASRTALRSDYPECEFHVVLWDKQKMWMSREIISGLRSRGIKIHLVSDILPDYFENEVKYHVSEFDHHPNRLANKTMAQYISREIISK
ncbi:MAG: hypothetical protein ACYTE3_19385 [Planctomycetota bacterium]|jgi:hypothetical protein